MTPIKYLLSLTISSLITVFSVQAQNQSGEDSTGLPGDNFSLQGALQMFQQAGSPEEFEKLINAEDNNVNNLDLNGDGDIDYIRVIDKMDKNAHAFVLQAVISETESQDIAVIELEKTGDTTAILQIIGDEDIYGEQVIAEPDGGGEDGAFNDDMNSGSTKGPNPNHYFNVSGIRINVWFWPSVRFVYAPVYVAWASPWRWHRYPVWWHPWRPLAWQVYYPLRTRYHRSFVIVHTHRVIHAHGIYTPFRTTSVIVGSRHQAAVSHYRVTRTTTIRRTNRGPVKVRTTTVRRKRRG
jgi:hypothetical protein